MVIRGAHISQADALTVRTSDGGNTLQVETRVLGTYVGGVALDLLGARRLAEALIDYIREHPDTTRFIRGPR